MRLLKLLSLLLLLSVPVSAQAQVPMTGAGTGAPGGAPAAYTGLCDTSVSGTACARYWGLRAASAATRGQNAIRICDSSTMSVCTNIPTDATTGKISVSTISGLTQCAVSCSIATIYEQMGSGEDVVFITAATAPVWNATAGPSSGFSGAVFSSASSTQIGQNTAATINQPVTITATYKKTVSSTNYSMIFCTDSGNFWIGATAGSTLNTAGTNAGTTERDTTASDSNWHNLTISYVSSTASLFVDGVSGTSASSGSHGPKSSYSFGQCSGVNFLDANLEEIAIWGSDRSGNAASISSNVHALFGF